MSHREIPDLTVLSIGEVLWDIVDGKHHLGGAPYNFAYHAKAAGARASIITRVGQDDLGAMIVQQAERLGVPTTNIQRDAQHATGTVAVTLDASGSPSYTITENVAWDHIQLYESVRDSADVADIFCFGTLAQRSPSTRAAILGTLAALQPGTLRMLDINLRAPFYDRSVIESSLRMADVLKLNAAELHELKSTFGYSGSESEVVQKLMRGFKLQTVVITDGEKGAAAWSGDRFAAVQGIRINAVDTIGSGDAFTARFAVEYQSHGDLEIALQSANLAGAYVATQPGATPPMKSETLKDFAKSVAFT